MATTIKSPTWDLSDLYQGITDPQIDKDMVIAEKASAKFAKLHRDNLPHDISATNLLQILKSYESILISIMKIEVYAHLIFSTHTEKQQYGAFLQKVNAWSTQVYNLLLFFELEILDIPKKNLQSLMKDPVLKEYKHYLRKEIDRKPHRLSEAQENILNQKSLTGRQAFIRLFNQRAATRTYEVKVDGKVKTLSESSVLDLFHSHSRPQRKEASKALKKVLTKEADLNSYVFNILVQDHAISTKMRKFASPEHPRHISNEVDQSTVDTLASVVTDNYKVVHDYYRFKKQLLGYKDLYEYDRYAPLTKVNRTFTFKEAKDIVLSSFQAFSPEIAAIAQKFFDNNWIDAAKRNGKQGGAYCMYATTKVHPYVFMNYSGNINDVMTLAHELGHAVHGELARKQSYLHYDWPLTISETASVFAETIVFNTLKNTLTSDKEKLALYCSRIEGMFATVFRQTSMYKFEQQVHKQHAEKGELPTAEINKIWKETQQAMFGKSMILTDCEDLKWSYVPHFIHTPFYVYSYAFGELLTLSLYAMYEKKSDNFVDNYINMLADGGSKSPQELLNPFGIDIHSRDFWQGGIDEIKTVVKEAKKLAKK